MPFYKGLFKKGHFKNTRLKITIMINRIIRGLNCEGSNKVGKVLAIVELDGTSHYQVEIKTEQSQNYNLDLFNIKYIKVIIINYFFYIIF